MNQRNGTNMPYSIPCSNTRCDNYVAKLGDLCKTCQQQEEQFDGNWRHRGWTRREDNESAKQGHKGNKDGKK